MADKRATDALTAIAGTMPAAPVSNGMPGGRAALPPGSLPRTYLGVQGDEQRDPPAGAPSAIPPSPSSIARFSAARHVGGTCGSSGGLATSRTGR
jgi:hypothetical protein